MHPERRKPRNTRAVRDAVVVPEGFAMIRPTTATETKALVDLADHTGVFKPAEIVALREVLDDYHAHANAAGHRSITLEHEGKPVGFAYYAAAAMTDRTWYLYWIAVAKHTQARGAGSALLRHAEEDIRTAGGRLLLIETSSLPHYELTRRFYLKHNYERDCVLHDYYADGDDMVVFRKRLST
jgi:ribosomal protein S18 acetylase RimI-like enzyme